MTAETLTTPKRAAADAVYATANAAANAAYTAAIAAATTNKTDAHRAAIAAYKSATLDAVYRADEGSK